MHVLRNRCIAVAACEDSNMVVTDFGDVYKWTVSANLLQAAATHSNTSPDSKLKSSPAKPLPAAKRERPELAAAVSVQAAGATYHHHHHRPPPMPPRPKLAREAGLKQVPLSAS
jgi:hypothetical protein